MDGHPQVDIADSVDGEPDRVFPGVEHTVLAGAVVFEFEEVMTVVKGKDIFCLACVNSFHDMIKV